MTPQCTFQFIKELSESLQALNDAFYYEDGRVIKEKDFTELVEAAGAFKAKVNEILDSCVGDMYGKTVSTSIGVGKVISHGMSGKRGKDRDLLVYKVVFPQGKEEFFYDYELEVQ